MSPSVQRPAAAGHSASAMASPCRSPSARLAAKPGIGARAQLGLGAEITKGPPHKAAVKKSRSYNKGRCPPPVQNSAQRTDSADQGQLLSFSSPSSGAGFSNQLPTSSLAAAPISVEAAIDALGDLEQPLKECGSRSRAVKVLRAVFSTLLAE